MIQFKDGRIGIFETKDESDQNGPSTTKAKAEALADYIASETKNDRKLFGGIAIKHGEAWKINSKKKYDWGKCIRGDWSDWERFDL